MAVGGKTEAFFADIKKREMAEYQRAHHSKHYAEHKARIFEVLGDECAGCGTSESLTVDHIDRSTKLFNPSRWGHSWDECLLELAKCQPLCVPCHQAKSAEERTMANMPHGLSRYVQRKCRCAICRASSAKYARERRARLRCS